MWLLPAVLTPSTREFVAVGLHGQVYAPAGRQTGGEYASGLRPRRPALCA